MIHLKTLLAFFFLSGLFLLFSRNKESHEVENPILGSGIYTNEYERLKLNEDSTFEYFFNAYPTQAFSSGKWRLQEDHVFLRSKIQRHSIQLEVKESYNPKATEIAFEITDGDGLWEPFFKIQVNGDSNLVWYYHIYEESIPVIKLDFVSSFQVFYKSSMGAIELKSRPYYPNKKANEFIISAQIPKERDTYQFFEETQVQINNDTLCFLNDYGIGFAPQIPRCLGKN
ncbi:MAG: hypothetical protein AAFP92_07625 [Bacteroidota bacterium]